MRFFWVGFAISCAACAAMPQLEFVDDGADRGTPSGADEGSTPAVAAVDAGMNGAEPVDAVDAASETDSASPSASGSDAGSGSGSSSGSSSGSGSGSSSGGVL